MREKSLPPARSFVRFDRRAWKIMHWVRPSSILLQFPKHVTETESTWQKNGDGTIRQKAGVIELKTRINSIHAGKKNEHMNIAAYDDVMTLSLKMWNLKLGSPVGQMFCVFNL